MGAAAMLTTDRYVKYRRSTRSDEDLRGYRRSCTWRRQSPSDPKFREMLIKGTRDFDGSVHLPGDERLDREVCARSH